MKCSIVFLFLSLCCSVDNMVVKATEPDPDKWPVRPPPETETTEEEVAKLENEFLLDYSVTSLEGAIVGNVEVLDPDFVDGYRHLLVSAETKVDDVILDDFEGEKVSVLIVTDYEVEGAIVLWTEVEKIHAAMDIIGESGEKLGTIDLLKTAGAAVVHVELSAVDVPKLLAPLYGKMVDVMDIKNLRGSKVGELLLAEAHETWNDMEKEKEEDMEDGAGEGDSE